MKCQRFLFSVSILAITLTGCTKTTRDVSKIAKEVRDSIPKGWKVDASNATIHIRSERDVVLIGRISRPPGSIEEIAQSFGRKGKYHIAIEFVPRLSDSELQKLRDARKPFEDVLNNGAKSKLEYGLAQVGYEKHRVPSFYTADYSIFVDRPIDHFVEVYPPDAAADVDNLMKALKKIFKEY